MNAPRSSMPGSTFAVRAVDEGVADGQVVVERRGVLQRRQARRPCSAATVSRKRAMATANGLRSTPWIASSADCTRAWISRRARACASGPAGGRTRRAGSGRTRTSGRSAGSPRAGVPSAPVPASGPGCTPRRTPASAAARTCPSRAADRSWYRSPRNRVDSVASCRSWTSVPSSRAVAPELEQVRRRHHRTATRSGSAECESTSAFVAGSLPR